MTSKTAIAFLISAVLFTSPALAQNSTTQGKIPVVKQRVEQKIGSKSTAITQKIDNVQAKIATREAALKAKLATFRDKKKAEITEKINTNLNRINQKRTEEMLKHLDKMTNILDRLEARVGATDAISSSRAVIASASSAVKEQAEKDYTITLTTETKVKQDAGKMTSSLQQDLKAVRKLVIDAKQSVANAIREAKSNGSK